MITHGMLRTILLVAIGVGLLTPGGQGPTKREELPTLSESVGPFHIENGTMEEGLRALRQTNVTRILIGLEKVTHRQNEKEKAVSLSLSGGRVARTINPDTNLGGPSRRALRVGLLTLPSFLFVSHPQKPFTLPNNRSTLIFDHSLD